MKLLAEASAARRCLMLALLVSSCTLNPKSLPAFGERCESSEDCDNDFVCFKVDEDDDQGVCIDASDVTPCGDDFDCNVFGGATEPGCESTVDCPDGTACIEGFEGEGFCVVEGDSAFCESFADFEALEVSDIDGDDVEVCMTVDGTCTDGGCTF